MIIKRKIIDISSVMSGINWDIYGVGPGYSQSTSDKELANFKLEITGFNYNDLLFYLNVLKRKLEGNKRIVKINIEANEYTNFFTEKEKIGIYPNDRNMALQGIDKLTFYQNLFEYKVNKNPNFNTIIANKYTSFYISPEDFDFDIWYYQNTNSLYNQITKLKDNTTTINSQYASPVFRNNQEYIKWVSFDFLGNNRFASSAIKKIIEDMNNNVLPLGFKCKLSKVQNSIDVESKNYSYSILFYLTIVYIIASIFMESLIAPLKIIYCTCLSFVGIFIASIHYNINFDIGGYASFFTISFFMLTILIYTYFLSKKGRGIGIVLLKISSVVLISAVAIITMLIPFMLLEETTFFWRSYCICTIGGIIFSVLNIFFIVPAILSPLKKSN